jgi:uncharacterized protein YuzE
MDVIVDRGIGSVYLGLHELEPDETGGVTHTMEKHGILLHWNGHGKLTGIEIVATGNDVRVHETNNIEAYIEQEP